MASGGQTFWVSQNRVKEIKDMKEITGNNLRDKKTRLAGIAFYYSLS